MNELALYNRYNFLINTVLRWKVIPLSSLNKITNDSVTAHTFRENVRRLEKNKLLKLSFSGYGREKIVRPSSELVSREAPHLTSEIVEENLQHDGLVTKLCLALLKYPIFSNVELPYEYRRRKRKLESRYDDLGPDAILWGQENGGSFCVALEVEVWRKDRERVYGKLLKYAQSEIFDFVFYFFLFENSFESYKKRLQELIGEAKTEEERQLLNEKVVLIFERKLLEKVSTLANGHVYVNETEKSFKDLLGEEREND